MEALRDHIHRLLIQEIDLSRLESLYDPDTRRSVEVATRAIATREAPKIAGLSRDELVEAVLDEVLGLGPVEPLVRDAAVSEIMVNGPEEIYFEREGRIHRSEIHFQNDDHVMRIVERIVAPLGRRVDESSPMVDARLRDGSRVNVVIPPVAVNHPTISIRKFRADKYKMDDLVSAGTLSKEIVTFLDACVKGKLNILVSGGTGAGKTTMLNALSSFIPHSERIITIEDPAEVKLQQPHVITLEARPPSIEGKGEVTPRDLVRNALRMRPDRIIIGEVRGAEAFDMLQAMNTGHEGSISTVHANTTRDAMGRVENMVLMAGFELPMKVIREQIASALDMIIQIQRFPDGVRRLTAVSEVIGLEGQTVTMQDIFLFRQHGIDAEGRALGSIQATGLRPAFYPRLEAQGIKLPPEIFIPRRAAA
ncbi:MAG: CpaF family protein [Dehalococcoidia bacterium]|nr:CpaF family protein [Dehalococcoidia bacterium]